MELLFKELKISEAESAFATPVNLCLFLAMFLVVPVQGPSELLHLHLFGDFYERTFARMRLGSKKAWPGKVLSQRRLLKELFSRRFHPGRTGKEVPSSFKAGKLKTWPNGVALDYCFLNVMLKFHCLYLICTVL